MMVRTLKIYMTLLLTVFLAFSFIREVESKYQIGYKITIHEDGSATWVVEQAGFLVKASVEAFESFIKNVSLLVNLTREKTQREMDVPDESFVMSVNIYDSYKIVRYQFHWKNFAEVKDQLIIIGDVFKVDDFFSYFYGNGPLVLHYPQSYIIKDVSPIPHEIDIEIGILRWYETEVFGKGETKIILEKKSLSTGLLETIGKNWVLIVALVVVFISGISVGLYYFRSRWEMKRGLELKDSGLKLPTGIESDEQKVINLLRAAGGRMYQSAIADKCGFSRSKASKLLKVLEDKGVIKRERKGRDKIVKLLKDNKVEHHA